MTLFLIIGAVGLALVVVALLIGDVLDGALHLDVLDSDLFSISSRAAFVGAFGFGGALGLAVIDHVAFAVVVGLVVGALDGAADAGGGLVAGGGALVAVGGTGLPWVAGAAGRAAGAAGVEAPAAVACAYSSLRTRSRPSWMNTTSRSRMACSVQGPMVSP